MAKSKKATHCPQCTTEFEAKNDGTYKAKCPECHHIFSLGPPVIPGSVKLKKVL